MRNAKTRQILQIKSLSLLYAHVTHPFLISISATNRKSIHFQIRDFIFEKCQQAGTIQQILKFVVAA